MKLLNYLFETLSNAGLNCSIQSDHIFVNELQAKYKISVPQDLSLDFDKYKKRKNSTFDEENLLLKYRNSIEVALTPVYYFERNNEGFTFSDRAGNTVKIGTSSNYFNFAHSETDGFKKNNLSDFSISRLKKYQYTRKANDIIDARKITATYSHKGKKVPENIESIGIDAIKKCLFKIAVDKNQCLTLWKPRDIYRPAPKKEMDLQIPIGTYDENAVNFYILGTSSPYPSQRFLSYYHALEYFFLKTSDAELHSKISTTINDTSFHTNRVNLERLIDIIRGADSKNDETEMLRKVISRNISPSEISKFVIDFESQEQKKILTKKRSIFGQEVQIHINEDNVISSTAHCLKHIRNAIVHASDKYKREDRHVPFSDSESVISDFIPLLRFISERVIFGAAE